MKKFNDIYKIQRIEKIKLFLSFWEGFLLVFIFSILFYLIAFFDTLNSNLYYLCGSFVLIFLTGFIEYPLVSRDVHIKFKNISLLFVILFMSISYILIVHYDYILQFYNLNKNFIPLFSLFLIPQINELLKKLIEFQPINVTIKFHDKSKMTVPDTGIKKWYWHDLSNEIKQKGLPIFITNNSKSPIIITNFRLEILNPPPFLPKLALRRICKLNREKYSNIYIFHEFTLENLLIIQPSHGELYIIDKNEIEQFYNLIHAKGKTYSRIMQPMYITAIDSFNLREHPSEKTYYPSFGIFFVV